MLVQMAISRAREYEADRRGAQICGNPLWLAAALQKIASKAENVENQPAEENPATAHMFIINPLIRRGADSLFSTHPATQNRIAALMRQAEEMPQPPTNTTQQRPNWMKFNSKRKTNKKQGPWG